jgi:hypothetical protein
VDTLWLINRCVWFGYSDGFVQLASSGHLVSFNTTVGV